MIKLICTEITRGPGHSLTSKVTEEYSWLIVTYPGPELQTLKSCVAVATRYNDSLTRPGPDLSSLSDPFVCDPLDAQDGGTGTVET